MISWMDFCIARRVVCELGRGSSELRNLLARPILGDGHGFGHRRHEDGGEVFRAFAAPLGVARDALPEPMFNGWLRSEVFLAQGFDAASMGEIARKAGVSKGTLYVYFDSKERLFEAIAHEECGAQARPIKLAFV